MNPDTKQMIEKLVGEITNLAKDKRVSSIELTWIKLPNDDSESYTTDYSHYPNIKIECKNTGCNCS